MSATPRPATAPAGTASTSHRLHAAAGVEAALAAVAAAAEEWGAEWEPREAGGRLHLPVQAGLRHGRLDVAVAATPAAAGGVELAFDVAAAAWSIHRTAVGLLVIAGLGALATLLWPFVPALGPLAPMGLVLGVAAWLVVVSRLRHHGVAELLEDVADRLAPGADAGVPAA